MTSRHPGQRPGAGPPAGSGRGRVTQGILRPVDYTARVGYRRPPWLYARLQWLGPRLARRGLVPSYVITIEVPGRRTGRLRRTTVVRVQHGGEAYVVALAGEGMGSQRSGRRRPRRDPSS